MENILMDGHCLSLYTCKCCIVFKQFDKLNFDGLAGKCQNFALYYAIQINVLHTLETASNILIIRYTA